MFLCCFFGGDLPSRSAFVLFALLFWLIIFNKNPTKKDEDIVLQEDISYR